MNRFVEHHSRLGAFPPSEDTVDDDDSAEILAELRREVARRCPEWTELGADDPRAVLLEVFAEALAAMRKRVDRLDDGLLPRFLEALGEEPRGVVPARGVIRFVSRAAAAEAARVPRGTVVSAPRAPGQPHIAYETNADAWCSAARLLRVVTSTAEGSGHREWTPFPQSGWDRCAGLLFAERVRPRRCLYLGDAVLSTLRSELGQLLMEWPGLSADGDGRHLIEGDWECSVEGGWRKVRIEWEQVGGSTPVLRSRLRGAVHDIAALPAGGLSSIWLRCALPGGVAIRLAPPEWVSSSAAPPGPPGATGLGRVAFNFPRPIARVMTRHEETWRDHSLDARGHGRAAAPAPAFEVARCPVEWDTAVYLGWDQPASASVYWELDGAPSAARGERGARFEWEHAAADGFSPLEVEDGTSGFSRSGTVSWKAPSGWTARELHGEKLFWVRARWVSGGYGKPPRVSAIIPHAVGIRQGRVLENVIHEVDFDVRGRGRLAISCADGEPESIDRLELEAESGTWMACRLDATEDAPEGSATGDRDQPRVRLRRLPGGVLELEAGPSWRGPTGVRLSRVRFCQGKRGDLPAGSLRILESDHPAVEAVTQPLATTGGVDSETAEELRRRVVAEWSASHRIVTARDLALMCRALAPEVERVEAEMDPVDAGLLRVTVIPRDPYARAALSVPRLRWLEEELADRLPIGTVVDAREPAYLRVEVVGRPRREGGAPPVPSLRHAVERRIREFFHPLEGGMHRRGLPARGWLPETGGFSSLMPAILAPREDSSLSGTDEVIQSWRFDLIVPGGSPASWTREDVAGAEVVFPVLDRLRFEDAASRGSLPGESRSGKTGSTGNDNA